MSVARPMSLQRRSEGTKAKSMKSLRGALAYLARWHCAMRSATLYAQPDAGHTSRDRRGDAQRVDVRVADCSPLK